MAFCACAVVAAHDESVVSVTIQNTRTDCIFISFGPQGYDRSVPLKMEPARHGTLNASAPTTSAMTMPWEFLDLSRVFDRLEGSGPSKW